MILLTVGTQLPFDRLVAAIDDWAGERGRSDIFGQISEPGAAGYRPRNFEWAADLNPAEFEARFDAATHIVAHAGMGTIIGALGKSKPLLVMPRRAHLGEQRNDHQFATVRNLCTRSGILVAHDAGDISKRMDALVACATAGAAPLARFAEKRLTDAIRAAISPSQVWPVAPRAVKSRSSFGQHPLPGVNQSTAP